ncbi:hypothetical protein [Alkalihalophilus marmarensis]|uniref:hypothetical protein n=1 Tax=Alkalihalophilus marmarensis TaxID=521377 RepID=UPI002DB573D6|nr:hypothetical protein [Alkalihalophilus marmarensis]MEC2074448.1 hypothetical protein [Alkalihalophilus marmarensis]
MLIHHTQSMNNIKSILNSGEIWLKQVSKTSDNREISHYMDEFNIFHYILELEMSLDKYLSNNTPHSLHQFLTYLEINKRTWQNKASFGSCLFDILRNNAYLVCFTEKENSEYHNTEYGKYTLEFKSNPLESLDSHFLLEEKVIYFDSKLVAREQEDLATQWSKRIENEDFSLYYADSEIETVKKWRHEVNYYRHKYGRIIEDNSKKFDKKLARVFKSPYNDLRRTLIFLNQKMIEMRAERKEIVLRTAKKHFVKISEDHKKQINEIVEEELANLIKKAHDPKDTGMIGQTRLNLMSVFLKDNYFKKDKETRIIAIPKNSTGLINQEWLKINFDFSKLIRIKIDSSVANKAEEVKILKTILKDLNQQQVIVE